VRLLSQGLQAGSGLVKGQGCLISPLSFNCYSEYVMRESVDEFSWIGITMSGRTINNLRYADDIVLIATSQEGLQTLIDKLSTVSHEYGLEINAKKTKVLVASKDATVVQVTCNNRPLEQVQSFRYSSQTHAIVERKSRRA